MKTTGYVLTMAVIAILLAGCSSSVPTAGVYGDDIYGGQSLSGKSSATVTQPAERDAQLRAEVAQAEANRAQQKAAAKTGYSYDDVVVTTYDSAYERRLRGFESPTYEMPESYYRNRVGNSILLAQNYDPSVYNIVVQGDEVWLEPKYLTSMFDSWGNTTVNIYNYGYGTGYYAPWGYWDPWFMPSYAYGWNWSWGMSWNNWRFGFGWGWNDPWYNPYWPWGDPYHHHHGHHGHHGHGGYGRPGVYDGHNYRPNVVYSNGGGRPGATSGTGTITSTPGRVRPSGGTVSTGTGTVVSRPGTTTANPTYSRPGTTTIRRGDATGSSVSREMGVSTPSYAKPATGTGLSSGYNTNLRRSASGTTSGSSSVNGATSTGYRGPLLPGSGSAHSINPEASTKAGSSSSSSSSGSTVRNSGSSSSSFGSGSSGSSSRNSGFSGGGSSSSRSGGSGGGGGGGGRSSGGR